MTKLLTILLLLSAMLLLIPAAAHTQIDRPLDVGRIETTECPIPVPDSIAVDCGALYVPENYEDPQGPSIRLPYIILRSPNPNHALDPLIFTTGGPGYSSLDSLWGFASSPMLEDRDIIIFEQRGNKFAEPSLVCEQSIWWEEALDQTPCLDTIRARGIDLTHYNIQNIARDLIALRQVLGYKQWNLYGTSFSTTLMLLLMEADAGATRSAILHSVKPPHITTFDHEADSGLRAIQQMFNDCMADPSCAANYPDLESQFYALVKELNQTPLEFEIWSHDLNDYIPITFTGDNLISWLMIDNYYQPTFPPFGSAYIPLLISEASSGNNTALQAAAQGYWGKTLEDSHWAWGLLLTVSCQQDLPAANSPRPASDQAASQKLDGYARSAGQRAICAAWDLPPQPLPADNYIQSDIPTLVFAGSYDPVTPPAWSQATADHLPNSTYVEFSGQGHNTTVQNPCTQTLQTNFLKDPFATLDTNCVEEAKNPSFALREDLFITPGLALSANDLEIGGLRGNPWLEGWWIASFIALLLSLIALVIIGLLWLVRWRKKIEHLEKSAVFAYLLALLIILSFIAIPVLTTQINQEYLNRQIFHFALGPSRDFTPAILLAWLSPLFALLIITLILLTLWAWLSTHWTLSFRLLITLIVLASIITIPIGIRWGLFTMLF